MANGAMLTRLAGRGEGGGSFTFFFVDWPSASGSKNLTYAPETSRLRERSAEAAPGARLHTSYLFFFFGKLEMIFTVVQPRHIITKKGKSTHR
jgi:hypothetical protein